MTGSPSPLPRLSAPATRALAAAGITDLRQLDGLPEKEILALHGVGPSQLGVLRDAMAAAGHAFADPVARPAPTGRNDNSAFLPDEDHLLARLGPHKTGRGCLYVTRLDRVDEQVLREMVGEAWARGPA
ncbi:hypothetical protein ES5_09672 [Dietzia cinnamea P4]|nr:hypothetical protein ES5_09672 [Dietzia cinnamea P4]